MEKIEVKEAKGKLGILVVGVGGAVATTMITGTLAARKGLAPFSADGIFSLIMHTKRPCMQKS